MALPEIPNVASPTNIVGQVAGTTSDGGSTLGTVASVASGIGPAVSIFSAISGGLLSIAQSLTAAFTKSNEGKSASESIMKNIGQVNSGLCANQDTFTKSLNGVNCGVKTCGALGSQGESVLENAFNILNGNGDLVGLQLNAAKTEGESENGQGKQTQGCNQGQGKSQNSATEVAACQQATPENNGEQKVYSCDWGNKAKSNEEIDNKNNSSLKKIVQNTGNKKLEDELKKIQGEKKNILGKSNSNGFDDIKEELKQRVEGDNQTIAATDAKNVEGLAKEKEYQQQIAANNQKGQNCMSNASNFTKQAVSKAQSASKDLLSGAEINKDAADLFKDPLNVAKAISKATKAVSKNKSASSTNDEANKLESNSRTQQQNALELVKNSQSNILPQLQQSTQSRLAENKGSLGVQNTTREFIESQLNGDKENGESNSMLDMLKDKEQTLMAKNDAQNGMMNLKNNKTLNFGNNSMNVTGGAMNGTGSATDFLTQKV